VNGAFTTGLQIVAGSSTVQITAPASTPIGGIIYSGLGGSGSQSSAVKGSGTGASGVVPFTGNSVRIEPISEWAKCSLVGLLMHVFL
jgi:hypothetical protein